MQRTIILLVFLALCWEIFADKSCFSDKQIECIRNAFTSEEADDILRNCCRNVSKTMGQCFEERVMLMKDNCHPKDIQVSCFMEKVNDNNKFKTISRELVESFQEPGCKKLKKIKEKVELICQQEDLDKDLDPACSTFAYGEMEE